MSPSRGTRFRAAARPAAVGRRANGSRTVRPSRCGKRGQQVRRWLERRGRRAVRPREKPGLDVSGPHRKQRLEAGTRVSAAHWPPVPGTDFELLRVTLPAAELERSGRGAAREGMSLPEFVVTAVEAGLRSQVICGRRAAGCAQGFETVP